MAIGGILQKAKALPGQVKNRWKGLSRDQKIETLTTLGAAAVSALTKPKKRAQPQEQPSIVRGGGYQGPGIGSQPQYQQVSRMPMSEAAQGEWSPGRTSKLAKRMRYNPLNMRR